MATEAREAEAREALQNFLQENADVFGPVRCPLHPTYDEDCECDEDALPPSPVPDVMVTEFVVMTSWTGMQDGNSYALYQTPTNQVMSHTLGLLTFVKDRLGCCG